MLIDNFLDLISRGFDVSFNYKEVFYIISLISDDENGRKYGIGSDNGFMADFESLESIPDFILDDKKIRDIVSALPEEEVFY
ncbi:MAG: hypothetical protein SPJ80_07010 [Bacilli bacterium]|nr:hypothetical protein [Bacilli bacterium]